MRMGRTIAERREKLETSSERLKAREKQKRKKTIRLSFTVIWFIIVALFVTYLVTSYFSRRINDSDTQDISTASEYIPTIKIVDTDATATGGKITERMCTYIGQVEKSFRELGYNPSEAVIPANSIREVDIYLNGYTGYLKMHIDRKAGVSVEDADRMLRYLKKKGISNFKYIDVRVEGKGYWK